jgi:parvulin-like peptidyl-prolyl isomerase
VAEPTKKPASKAKTTSKPDVKTAAKAPASKSVAAKPAPEKVAEKATASTTPSKRRSLNFKMPSRKTLIWVGGGIAAALVVLLLVFGVLIYKYQSDNPIVFNVAKVVPYPVERVNGAFVSYGEYLFEVNSIKQYYQSQSSQEGQAGIDFKTDEGKAKLKELRKQILDQLKTDTVTRQLVAKHKIKVTSKDVNDQIEQIVKASGGQQKVQEVLTRYYGWTMNDLREKVSFQLAKQKLQEKLASDDSINAQAKAKAEDVLGQVKAGGDFAELAKKYSEDSSASNGGDLGFFGKGQMVKEFEDVAYGLQPGQTSELVKTKFGYHIIRVLEKKDDQVKAAHILIKGIDFEQYVSDEVNKAKVSVYLKV